MVETSFCTDEDIAVRSTDYPVLVPLDQVLAHGADGNFAAGSTWVLTSTSVDFTTAGVQPAMVCLLTQPETIYRAPGDLLIVNAVAGSALTLRRKGQLSGVGHPPGPITGVNGVEFTVLSLAKQIEDASYEIARRFGVNDLLAGRTPTDLYDLRELNQATVLTVLYRLYISQIRQPNDSFQVKAQLMFRDLTEVLDSLQVHWRTLTGPQVDPASRFSTRLTR